ncbi:uncharacterized protein [Penaeus vannamei]|uniref:uncharacterized protein n=1 Tax=Penaeus vannamei TaxID=6689 RepID=UPI000F65A1F7|nr:uncharacterized protein LOC113808796 [Penaeus vannamei]
MQKAALALAVICALFHAGAALKCYSGVGDTSKTVDCRGSCMKTAGAYEDNSGEARNCSPIYFKDDCHEQTALVTVEVCYCNTDYCNGAPHAAAAASWPLALASLALALRAALL